jgi:hypothetical protein
MAKVIYDEWMKGADTAHSYRQMYKLAQEILVSTTAPVDICVAARAVADALSPIIELPIASSHTLKDARLHFSRLKTALQEYAALPASEEVEAAA